MIPKSFRKRRQAAQTARKSVYKNPKLAPTLAPPNASQNSEETEPSKSGVFSFLAKLLPTNFFNKETQASTEESNITATFEMLPASLSANNQPTSTKHPISLAPPSSTLPTNLYGPLSSPIQPYLVERVTNWMENLEKWLNPQKPINPNPYTLENPQQKE
ncbi:MAG: hypothetical protein ACKO46_02670 [Alphaproteobacteria bacterium]